MAGYGAALIRGISHHSNRSMRRHYNAVDDASLAPKVKISLKSDQYIVQQNSTRDVISHMYSAARKAARLCLTCV